MSACPQFLEATLKALNIFPPDSTLLQAPCPHSHIISWGVHNASSLLLQQPHAHTFDTTRWEKCKQIRVRNIWQERNNPTKKLRTTPSFWLHVDVSLLPIVTFWSVAVCRSFSQFFRGKEQSSSSSLVLCNSVVWRTNWNTGLGADKRLGNLMFPLATGTVRGEKNLTEPPLHMKQTLMLNINCKLGYRNVLHILISLQRAQKCW